MMIGSHRWMETQAARTGTHCPRREVVRGGWNMTPKQEMEAQIAWLRSIGTSESDIATMVVLFRRGYTEEALGSVH
jgi:hypothetical protein